VFKKVIKKAKYAATLIQKRIRGYLLRKRNRDELKMLEEALGSHFYNSTHFIGLGKKRDPLVLYV
jgi:hypothetical protein